MTKRMESKTKPLGVGVVVRRSKGKCLQGLVKHVSQERGTGLVRSQDKDQELTTGFDRMEGMTDLDKSS